MFERDCAPRAGKVLVVEDEAMVGMLIEDMLIDLGYHVIATAARLDEAIELARASDIDFAVLDVNLGGHSSQAVADILKGRRIPFFFASGYGAQIHMDGHNETPVVQKPFQMQEFAEAIDRALSGASRVG